MAVKKNKKWSTPYLPSIAGYAPRVSKMLDGSVHAFFGPGQRPSVIGATYSAPTDWLPVGMPLFPPQVVWLEARLFLAEAREGQYGDMNATCPLLMGGSGTVRNDVYRTTGSPDKFHPPPDDEAWGLHFIDGEFVEGLLTSEEAAAAEPPWPPPPPAPPPHEQVQPNLAMTEKKRLADVFAAVKTRVEAKRPNRTWVMPTNWEDGWTLDGTNNGTITGYDGSGSPPTVPTQVVVAGEVEDASGPFASCLATFLESPHSSYPPYYGTDFFSIYCGNVFLGPGHDSTWYAIDWSPPSSLLSDATFANQYNEYKASWPKFHRLSTRLYHPDMAWDTWATDIDASSVGVLFPSETWSASHPHYTAYSLGIRSLPVYETAAVTHFYKAFSMDDFTNRTCSGMVGKTSDLFDAVAAQAAGDELDVTHPGGTSMVTEDYLYALIAGHFRFDPDTGEDLPG